MASQRKAQRFSATLYKVGVNRCVDVPERVGKALGKERYVPVVATVKGHSVRTTLVPAGAGRYRLFLTGEVRKAAGVKDGEVVSLLVEPDKESRELPVPKDLAHALKSTKGGRAAFDSLTPIQRGAFVQSIVDAKKPETRRQRIKKGIGLLLEMAARKSRKAKAR